MHARKYALHALCTLCSFGFTLADGVLSSPPKKSYRVPDPCIALCQATYMWKVEEGDYRDDITVIVLKLPWLPPQASGAGSSSSGP